MLTLLVSAPHQPHQAAGAKRLHHEHEGCIGAARVGRNARLHHDVALALGPQGQRQWLQHHHRAERWQLRVTEPKPLRVGPHVFPLTSPSCRESTTSANACFAVRPDTQVEASQFGQIWFVTRPVIAAAACSFHRATGTLPRPIALIALLIALPCINLQRWTTPRYLSRQRPFTLLVSLQCLQCRTSRSSSSRPARQRRSNRHTPNQGPPVTPQTPQPAAG